MTWIAVNPNAFGYAVCVSDIQVSFGDRRIDCLQKVAPIARNILCGFAGNVWAGFQLQDLAWQIAQDVGRGQIYVSPQKLLSRFSKAAKNAYEHMPRAVNQQPVEIVIAGVRRSKGALPGRGLPNVSIFRAPAFKEEVVPVTEWNSMGSGNAIEGYMKAIGHLNQNKYSLVGSETHNTGGYGEAMASELLEKLRKLPRVDGISRHFHVAQAFLQGCRYKTSYSMVSGEGSGPKLLIPKVVDNWSAFETLVRGLGLGDAALTRARASILECPHLNPRQIP